MAGSCSSQFFLALLDPTSASETFEIPATMVAIFFFPEESTTSGETLSPPDNLLPGESDVRRGLGDGCFLPVGEGCRYLDGTIIAGSFDTFRFSSRAETRLGTTHLEGTGDADLFPFPAGDGSLSAVVETILFLPADCDLLAVAGDENLCGGKLLSRGARGSLEIRSLLLSL